MGECIRSVLFEDIDAKTLTDSCSLDWVKSFEMLAGVLRETSGQWQVRVGREGRVGGLGEGETESVTERERKRIIKEQR